MADRTSISSKTYNLRILRQAAQHEANAFAAADATAHLAQELVYVVDDVEFGRVGRVGGAVVEGNGELAAEIGVPEEGEGGGVGSGEYQQLLGYNIRLPFRLSFQMRPAVLRS